eukprot:CAMPEP_0185761906 /NCGR_PEP_ID=MMETSP1174-20130828/20851_1 /TAXON_ID=35687 /ORGANISM="Dictyocha speculum, Strain CCMP1381" /LENGTH=183 /DNA_ID=CAMNT_0028443335 /DNA_START=47 /DNA_END=594 /DNA_ORIENTATION=+
MKAGQFCVLVLLVSTNAFVPSIKSGVYRGHAFESICVENSWQIDACEDGTATDDTSFVYNIGDVQNCIATDECDLNEKMAAEAIRSFFDLKDQEVPVDEDLIADDRDILSSPTSLYQSLKYHEDKADAGSILGAKDPLSSPTRMYQMLKNNKSPINEDSVTAGKDVLSSPTSLYQMMRNQMSS